jgi:hypothetical protein
MSATPLASSATTELANAGASGSHSVIRLVIADVDGTLVTREKVLTERACAAVAQMCVVGIGFAITRGRRAVQEQFAAKIHTKQGSRNFLL